MTEKINLYTINEGPIDILESQYSVIKELYKEGNTAEEIVKMFEVYTLKQINEVLEKKEFKNTEEKKGILNKILEKILRM